MPYGCEAHAIQEAAVDQRWTRLEEIIHATPEEDHDAQWSVITMCTCCGGPRKLNTTDEVFTLTEPECVCSKCKTGVMPNLKGRYEYSNEKGKEGDVYTRSSYVPSPRCDCLGGCGEQVAKGQKCVSCAARAVDEWLKTRHTPIKT